MAVHSFKSEFHAPGASWRRRVVSGGKPPRTVFEPAEDLAVTAAAQIVRNPPYVDRASNAQYPDTHAWCVRTVEVAAPIAAGAEDRHPGQHPAGRSQDPRTR